jgi:hypothetical protein
MRQATKICTLLPLTEGRISPWLIGGLKKKLMGDAQAGGRGKFRPAHKSESISCYNDDVVRNAVCSAFGNVDNEGHS